MITPTISVTQHELRIAVTVTHADVVTAAREAESRGVDLTDWVNAVLRAGAAAASVAATGAELATVTAALERLTSQTTTAVTSQVDRLTDAQHGAVTVAVDRLARGVQELLLEDGRIPRALRAATREALESSVQEIARTLDTASSRLQTTVAADSDTLAKAVADAATGTSREVTATVLHRTDRIVDLLTELRQALAVQHATTATPVRTSRQGLDYERAVATALAAISLRARHGGADFVGSKPGADGTRVGDVVATLSPTTTLVAEAKDRPSSPLSASALQRELAAARSNRSATVAIGVIRRQNDMPGQLPLAILSPVDIAVVYDPETGDDTMLATAYAAMCLLGERTTHGPIDQGAVLAIAESALSDLKLLDIVDTQISQITRNLTSLQQAADTARTRLSGRITDLQTALKGNALDNAGSSGPPEVTAA